MCAQDLSNAQSVDAPVAGSLRVQQPHGDKDKGKRLGTLNGVRANSGPTRSSKWKVGTRNKPTKDGKPGVRARCRMTKLKSSANCCVSCKSQQRRDNSSNDNNKLRRFNESAVTVNLIRI